MFLLAPLQVRLGEVQPQPQRTQLGLQEAEHVVHILGKVVDVEGHRLVRPGDGDVDGLPEGLFVSPVLVGSLVTGTSVGLPLGCDEGTPVGLAEGCVVGFPLG